MSETRIVVRNEAGVRLGAATVGDLWQARNFGTSCGRSAVRIECFRPAGKIPVAVLVRPNGRGRWLRSADR